MKKFMNYSLYNCSPSFHETMICCLHKPNNNDCTSFCLNVWLCDLYVMVFYAVDHSYQAWLNIWDSLFCTKTFYNLLRSSDSDPQVFWIVLCISRGLRTDSFSQLAYTVIKHRHLCID